MAAAHEPDPTTGRAGLTASGARAQNLPTLRELLAVPGLRLRLRSGEASLERPVRWVHATELPDPRRYLRGGELVCTVGVSMTEALTCWNYARAVSSAGAAAICFGVGDVHPEVPAALLQSCSELGIPLLELPAGAPFLALSEYVADRWVWAETAANDRGEELLARLLRTLADGGTAEQLLAIAAKATNGQVRVSEGVPASPTWAGEGRAPAEAVLTQVALLVDVARRHDAEAERQRRRTVGTLLELVGDGLADARALEATLASYGLPHDELTVSAWPAGTADRLVPYLSGALVGDAVARVLTVTAGQGPVRAAAARTGLPCGLGTPGPAHQLARAVAEARAAYDVAQRSGGVVGREGLTTLEALLEQQPSAVFVPFVDQLIRPLIDTDWRHGTAQLQTLRVFLRNEGSLQRTAQEQFLHVNTVRHRLAGVHRLTGRDPLRFADRTAFAVALWAADRRGAPRRVPLGPDHTTHGSPS